jgi:hypothetical protein
MARFNPELMQLDDSSTGTKRVFGAKTDTTKISEIDMAVASIEAGRELGVDAVTLAYEQGQAGIYTGLNKMSAAEQAAFQQGRSDKQTEERKFGTPDNPQPYDAPAGANWNNYNGVWKLYYKGNQIGDANGFDPAAIEKIDTAGSTPNNGNIPGNSNTSPAVTTDTPGSDVPSGPTLAFNTFKKTLGLFFGQDEVNKAWVNELYNLASPYYKTGSTVDEALNLALQEGRKNPSLKEFTARFDGIFKLQDKLVAGMAVTVPTIAEFVASEAKMGEVLNSAGLGSLNTQKFLGERIGDGLNVAEFTKRINDVYLRIDNLPQQAKQTINRYLPTVDKPQLAKALLMGSKGAAELAKDVASYEVLSAAEQQGLGTLTTAGQIGLVGGVDLTQAADFAAMGYDFNTANQALGQVAYNAPTYEKILEINTGKDVTAGAAAQGLIQSDIKKLASSERAKAQAIATEAARFAGSSGNLGSRSFKTQTSI